MRVTPAARVGRSATRLPRGGVWACVGVALAVVGAGGAEPDAGPTIELAGTVAFPDSAIAPDGTARPLRGLSGLAWVGGDRWVAVMDNSDQIVTFTLELSADAVPRAVTDVRLVPLSARHDYEDVAVCPPALLARSSRPPFPGGAAAPDLHLLLCEEDTPAVHVVNAAAGRVVGTLPVPALFKTRRPNRGFESLAVDSRAGVVWTATEEALEVDGPPPTDTRGTVVRLLGLPVGAGTPRQIAYAVDPPHRFVRLREGAVFSGLVAMVPLPDGRLLALERSAGPGLPPFESRIHVVDPGTAPAVEPGIVGLASRPELFAAKRLLWRGGLAANLEGLAAGPPTAAGSPAVSLVAISDNDGLGSGGMLVGFRLVGASDVTSP